MALYVAKAIRCDTNQTVEFNAGDVCLPEWAVNSSFQQQQETFNEFDDLFVMKDLNQITLKIGIACNTTDEARSKAEEICSVLSQKAKLYLFDDRYTYVMPRNFSPKFPDDTATYVDMTINLTASPYFYKDVVNEFIVTPTDYPTRVEMENPDPRLNVQFGTYNAATGLKIADTDTNTSKINNAFAGYSGTGYLQIVSNTSDGFSLDIYSSCVIRLLNKLTGRKCNVFVDGVLYGRFESNNLSDWVDYQVNVSSGGKHILTVVQTSTTADLNVDYIDLSPSSIQTLLNTGTADSYPTIEISPTDTSVRYSPLGKVAGDITHPVKIDYLAATTTPGITTTMTEATQSLYDKATINDGTVAVFGNNENSKTMYVKLAFDLKALKSAIPTSWTPEEIKSVINSITSRCWVYGEGAVTKNANFASDFTSWGEYKNTGTTVTRSIVADVTASGGKIARFAVTGGGTQDWHYQFYQSLGNFVSRTKFKLKIRAKASANCTPAIYIRKAGSINFGGIVAMPLTTTWAEFSTQEITITETADVNVSLDLGLLNNVTIDVDYISVIAYGVELNMWRGNWAIVAGHNTTLTASTPSLVSYILTSTDLPYFLNAFDGKIYILIKAKYPSDGITASTVYLDHCNFDLTYSRAVVGTDVVTNRAKNLLPPFQEWAKTEGLTVISDYEADFINDAAWQARAYIYIPCLPNTLYTFLHQSPRVTNTFYLQYVDKNKITSMLWRGGASLPHQHTEMSPPNAAYILVQFQSAITGSVVTALNPILTQTDSVQPFASQEKHTISLSQSQSIPHRKKLLIKSDNDSISLDGINLIQYAGSSYLSNGFLIRTGLNHLQFNNTGSLMKVKVKYKEKFNTP